MMAVDEVNHGDDSICYIHTRVSGQVTREQVQKTLDKIVELASGRPLVWLSFTDPNVQYPTTASVGMLLVKFKRRISKVTIYAIIPSKKLVMISNFMAAIARLDVTTFLRANDAHAALVNDGHSAELELMLSSNNADAKFEYEYAG